MPDLAQLTLPSQPTVADEKKTKKHKENWSLCFITQSRLCYKDWLLPPGELVPLTDGRAYVETTIVAAQICDEAGVAKVRILLQNGKFLALNESMSDAQVSRVFSSAAYLHESSIVVRSRISPYGGSGFFFDDISGWRDVRYRPLAPSSVHNLFDRTHTRYRTIDPSTQEPRAYIWDLIHLSRERNQGIDADIAGVQYLIGENPKPREYPDFLHLTCEDYLVMAKKRTRNSLAVPDPTDLQFSLKQKAAGETVYAKQIGYSLSEHTDNRMYEGCLEECQEACINQGLFSTSGRLLHKQAFKYLYPVINIKYVDTVYGLDSLAAKRACELVNGGVGGGI